MALEFVVGYGQTFNGDRLYRPGERVPLSDETGLLNGRFHLGRVEARRLTEEGIGRVASNLSGLTHGSSAVPVGAI